MDRGIAPFPWASLPRVPRGAPALFRRLRGRLQGYVNAERLGAALGELLATDVRIVLRRAKPAALPSALGGVQLRTVDDSTTLEVAPEAQLVTVALSRLLSRPAPLTAPEVGLDPSVRGALAALLIEAARRSGASVELRAGEDGATSAGAGVRIDATVVLDERPYGVTVWAQERSPTAPLNGSAAGARLGALGAVPVRLHVVAAVSVGARAEVTALRAGDVWLPGDGWFAEGRAALAGPSSEQGVAVRRSADGRLVLVGDGVALVADAEATPSAERGSMSDPNPTLTENVLDAPVVVRVEVASVTLSAREWAALRPGDVLETGVALAEPVVLRIAGREVARGELVSVDGELGVRIREILGGEG